MCQKGIIVSRKIKFSIPISTFLAVVFYYFFCVVQACLVFINYDHVSILLVSGCFLFLLLAFQMAFFGDFLSNSRRFNLETVVVALLISVFMWALSNTFYDSWFTSYFPTFPLLEAELGLGWHRDTAYHVSLIQSILNFGYPSIAQNGAVPTYYHVLSHYIDSLILMITGLEPYDSYGMLGWFKVFLYVSASLCFVGYVTRKQKPLFYLCSVFLVLPLMVGTWHSVGSHGLWFTSVIIVFSAPLVFKFVSARGYVSRFDYVIVFFLVIFVSLGKVSSGFVLAAFLGFATLANYPKRILTYVLGTVWLTFFYCYHSLLTSASATHTKLSSSVQPLSLSKHYFDFLEVAPNYFLLGVLSFLFLLSLCFTFHQKNTFKITWVAGLTLLAVYWLTFLNPHFSTTDIAYFQFGAASVVFLISFQVFAEDFYAANSKFSWFTGLIISSTVISFFVLMAFVPLYYGSPGNNVLGLGVEAPSKSTNTNQFVVPLKDVNVNQFTQINSKLRPENKLSLAKNLLNGPNVFPSDKFPRPLYEFRQRVINVMEDARLSKFDVALFVPRKVYDMDMASFGGSDWAKGLLLYSVTGVQLVRAVSYKPGYFGYASYGSESKRISYTEFSGDEICHEMKIKAVLSIKSLNSPDIDVFNCGGDGKS